MGSVEQGVVRLLAVFVAAGMHAHRCLYVPSMFQLVSQPSFHPLQVYRTGNPHSVTCDCMLRAGVANLRAMQKGGLSTPALAMCLLPA